MLDYISYGGGVQSTAMILMSLDGVLDRPDMVVFSDTGSEMPSTYNTVDRIEEICNSQDLDFYRVKADTPSIKKPLHEWYLERGTLPMVGVRWCTDKFKVQPIRKFVQGFVDKSKPKPWMNAWLGITSDEARRATGESYVKYQVISYPILEYSRTDCEKYIQENYPELEVSKSGCFCCPYSHKTAWMNLRKNHKDLFDKCLEMEDKARKGGVKRGLWGEKSIQAFNYTHTLVDFGVEIEEAERSCDPAGSCFI